MARSVGEAAALGLESGFIIGRNTQQMARENARRDLLDQQNAEDRQMQRAAAAEQLARQKNLDRIAASQRIISANDQAQAADAGEVTRSLAAGAQVPAARQLEITKAAERRRQENARAWSIIKGEPVTPDSNESMIDPQTFMPGPNGEPPARAAAVMQVAQAIQSDDIQAAIPGLNVLHGPSVQKIIGRPSKHGGTIIGAEIVDLEMAPGGPPDDPQYIPTLKIMVGNEDGNPIGEYFAPATEGGSTEDNAKILRFGLKDQAKLLDENMRLVQAMSSPEGQAKWKQVMAQIGAVEPKPVVKEFTVGQGAKHVTQRRDPVTGKVIDESVIEGNEKKPSPAQEALDLFEKYPERFKTLADARAFVTPSKAANQAAGVGGGGKGGKAGEGGDAAGISTAEKRALDVQRDALKRRSEALDKRRQRINDDFKDDMPEPLSTAEQFNEDAKAARAVKVEAAKRKKADALKALDKEAETIAEREAALDARMTNTEGPTAANPKPKPTGGAGRTLADAPTKAPPGAKDFSSLWK